MTGLVWDLTKTNCYMLEKVEKFEVRKKSKGFFSYYELCVLIKGKMIPISQNSDKKELLEDFNKKMGFESKEIKVIVPD